MVACTVTLVIQPSLPVSRKRRSLRALTPSQVLQMHGFKSLRFRTYGKSSRNPFILRTYKNSRGGGVMAVTQQKSQLWRWGGAHGQEKLGEDDPPGRERLEVA